MIRFPTSAIAPAGGGRGRIPGAARDGREL